MAATIIHPYQVEKIYRAHEGYVDAPDNDKQTQEYISFTSDIARRVEPTVNDRFVTELNYVGRYYYGYSRRKLAHNAYVELKLCIPEHIWVHRQNGVFSLIADIYKELGSKYKLFGFLYQQGYLKIPIGKKD
jgi:hypothetical protein